MPEQLARVIDNILDNAGHHGTSGGFVDVRRLAAALEVRDQGAGIGEDELPLVFDRFFRGASAREHHGAGLGLVSVRQVVEGPGGRSSALNAPGRGLLVRLALTPVEAGATPPEVRVP